MAKHLGDNKKDIIIRPRAPTYQQEFDSRLVESCQKAMPDHIRKYLNERGIIDSIIDQYKIGWGKFYNKWWITIPIPNFDGENIYFKLRQDPALGDRKCTYPNGVEAQIYGWDAIKRTPGRLIICEGELDRLASLSKDVPAITSTHGALTFKQEWFEKTDKNLPLYICFDNDNAGRQGASRLANMSILNGNKTYIVTLPEEVGVGGDLTDYFVKLKGTPDDLFGKYAKEYPEKIDTSKFKELNMSELIEILSGTVKHDDIAKLIVFLCYLAAYTECSQFNVIFVGPSSSGKSYIAIEISGLFPNIDIITISYCSPKAFFHEQGIIDPETGNTIIDLSRKIILFLDQPHTQLLENLRSLLSHDNKTLMHKIVSGTSKRQHSTKSIIIKGYPSVVFCTSGLKIDLQESSRCLLLSPETNQSKLQAGISEKITKKSDSAKYQRNLETNPERKLLMERIQAIKEECISDIIIKPADAEQIKDRFLKKHVTLQPRHQRDIERIMCLIQSLALLNLWFRERSGVTITANQTDIDGAFAIWDKMSESQEIGLAPYILNIYKEVVVPAYEAEKQSQNNGIRGVSRQEIRDKHYQVYGYHIQDTFLRHQVIPMLITVGLITEKVDPDDRRQLLICLTNFRPSF